MTADVYLRRVENELRDLPWRQRRDLVSELRGHLSELPPDTDLEARLGKPEEYATDLRAAEGLEYRRGAFAFVRAGRPRNVILAVSAFLIVALALGSVAFIQTYQPLAFGGPSTVHGPVSVSFHPGYRFSLAVDVENSGRFPVRVLAVPHSSGPFAGRSVSARVMMSRDIGENRVATAICGHRAVVCRPVVFRPDGPYVPFQPFDLQPGRERALLLVGVYGDCLDESNLVPISVSAFPVRYSFLWKTATASIPLPKEREIIPPSGGCPSGFQASLRLRGGESHLFKAGVLKTGTRVFCLSHGVRAGARVPKRGQSAVGTAAVGTNFLPSDGATLRITTRPDGSVAAHCR
jgi:HAAS